MNAMVSFGIFLSLAQVFGRYFGAIQAFASAKHRYIEHVTDITSPSHEHPYRHTFGFYLR
jgi:hypothetical protein